MSKRKRWQPPYPDPRKANHVRQNAEQVSDSLKRSLRKHVTCAITGCRNPADERAMDGGVTICLHHLHNAVARFPDTEFCQTCASAATPAPHEEPPKQPGVASIYYLQIDELIKIGWTTNLDQRMRAYPPTAKLLAVEPGSSALERSRHQQFNEYLAHGREWFTPGRFLLEHVQRLVNEHGEPPPVAALREPAKQHMPQRMKQTMRGSYKSTSAHDGSAAVKRPAA